MNDLVIIDKEPYVDSRLMAERLGTDHRSTFRLILKHQNDFEDSGQLRFKIAVGKRMQGGGNPTRYVLLNEEQSVFLLTLTKNTSEAVALKKDLSKQFVGFRRLLHRLKMRQTKIDWMQKRFEVKESDSQAMDMVLEFVDVAEVLGQARGSAERTFGNTHRMIYKELFGLKISKKNPLPANFRDNISKPHLEYLKMALKVVNNTYEAALMCCTDYHVPYYAAKEKMKGLVKLLGGPFDISLEIDFIRPRQMPLTYNGASVTF